jgi:hypothetical protein
MDIESSVCQRIKLDWRELGEGIRLSFLEAESTIRSEHHPFSHKSFCER